MIRLFFRNIFANREYRDSVILMLLSAGIAAASAIGLEARFFSIYLPESIAYPLSFLIVVGATWGAHKALDNLRSREFRGRRFVGIILALCYAVIAVALLGMCNYTMKVSKTIADTARLKTAISKVEAMPEINFARQARDRAANNLEESNSRIRAGIVRLEKKEDKTDLVYASQKRLFEAQILDNNAKIALANETFSNIRNAEINRQEKYETDRARTGIGSSGLGSLLMGNPAILPVTTLVILFFVRWTFAPAGRQEISHGLTMTSTRKETTHSVSFTIWSKDAEGFLKFVEFLENERAIGNGAGLQAKGAKYFGVQPAQITRAVGQFKRGSRVTVPTVLASLPPSDGEISVSVN